MSDSQPSDYEPPLNFGGPWYLAEDMEPFPAEVAERSMYILYTTRPVQVVRQVRHLPDHFSGQTPKKTILVSPNVMCANHLYESDSELKFTITKA